MDVVRISPEEAHQKASAGQAVLVCAYHDEERCRKMKLEGSISMQEFESRLAQFPKYKEMIFY